MPAYPDKYQDGSGLGALTDPSLRNWYTNIPKHLVYDFDLLVAECEWTRRHGAPNEDLERFLERMLEYWVSVNGRGREQGVLVLQGGQGRARMDLGAYAPGATFVPVPQPNGVASPSTDQAPKRGLMKRIMRVK